MPQGLTDLSLALAMRLRDMARMLDRLDRLESGTGEWLSSLVMAYTVRCFAQAR
jgi:hypothetical protein